MSYYPTDCAGCGKPIEGAWDSQIELGVETGEIADKASNRLFIYDKHIRCSPSRAQRIVHPDFPPVVEEREAFDQRLWPEDRREKFRVLYTEAWVRLQSKHNPNWVDKEARGCYNEGMDDINDLLEQVKVEIKNFSEDFPESRGEMLTDVLCHRIEEQFDRFKFAMD
jgi:hypothetical protein